MNMQQGVGLCRGCNRLTRVGELVSQGPDSSLLAYAQDEPPEGAWAHDDGREVVVGASMRSVAGFFGALAFGLFWNGIVSVFVAVNLASTLNLLGVGVPHWFPAPVMNGSTMGVGMTIFLWVFLTPFMVIGLAMIGAALAALMGRVEVRVGAEEGRVFTGIGSLGWTQRFDPRLVTRVRYEDKTWTDSDGDRRQKVQIVLEAEKPIAFGSSLPVARRRYVAGMLAQLFQA